MKKLKLFLADEHKFITEGLKSLLEPAYEVVGIVEDGHALVRQALKVDPDIIVMGISMPKLNGFEAVLQLQKSECKAKVIFLTMHHDVAYASRALKMGASGFILKHSSPDELLIAIEMAMIGKTFITEKIAKELGENSYLRRSNVQNTTPRQREVLQLLAEGYRVKQIGAALFVSPRTVEFHKYRIMEELSLKNSAELVHYAIKNGIVSIYSQTG
jgi:DNA-binding NarL/FixJ family response regulator